MYVESGYYLDKHCILYDILQEGRARGGGGEISKEKNFTDFMVHMTTNL